VSAAAAAPAPVTIVAHEVGTGGGMESQLATLVGGLLERGHEVTVVAKRCEVPAHERMRWIRVRGPARPFVLRFSWFFLAGSVAAHRHRRGVLHATGALVANRADVSTVHFCHRAFARTGLSRADREGRLYRVNAAVARRLSRGAESFVYRPGRTEALVGVSRGLSDELRAMFPAMAANVTTIANGVDLDRFRPDPVARLEVRAELGLDEHQLVGAFVGSEWVRKGLADAITALASAQRWSLVIIGSGNEELFRKVAEDAGVTSRVHFLGRRRDVPRVLAASDAFVLPTAYETFSLATFEAAASGLPVLNTRVHGVEELLVDGVNGWFIGRDAAEIAQRLLQLENPRVRAQMGDAARGAARAFTWDAAVDAYGEMYGRLLPSRG
jgi:glycosyltransferase involved in cell wall biosynthesis